MVDSRAAVTILVSWLLAATTAVVTQRNSSGSRVSMGVTVSSLITTSPPRQLEVTWRDADDLQPGDLVSLFDSDPLARFQPPLASHRVTAPQGHFRTNIQAPRTSHSELGNAERCLGYWAGYLRNGSVLAANCLRTHPTWMWDHRNTLKRLRLRHMFMPGTHDSAAYKVYRGGDRETFVTKYAITQEEDVLSQLTHGIRYLDLRVGYYKTNTEVWWANHGVVRIHPLRDILEQIKIFMRKTNEIVIIDIQEFSTGFGKELDVHLKLVQFLVNELGPYVAPPSPSLSWDATLEDVWNSGRRLIVSYDHPQVVAQSTLLWPAVEHRWGDVQSLHGLHRHLKGAVAKSPGQRPWAAMAELTPNTWSILTNKLGSLREMADTVNRNVSEWFRGAWGAKANVVAVDFFRGTEIVDVAIEWNMWRGAMELEYS